MADKLVYDMKEVNELTGIPVATLRFLRKNNRGPIGFRLGNRVVYYREDIEAYIDAVRKADLAKRARRGQRRVAS